MSASVSWRPAAGWFVSCIERFERAWNSHVQYDPRGRFLKLRDKESITGLYQAPCRRRPHLRRRRGRRADPAVRRQRRRQQTVCLLVGLPARGQQRHLQGRTRRAGRKPAADERRQRRRALSQRGAVLRIAELIDLQSTPPRRIIAPGGGKPLFSHHFLSATLSVIHERDGEYFKSPVSSAP